MNSTQPPQQDSANSNPVQDEPNPIGELVLQTLAMPRDTNANGDIFGGWLVSQMDLAAGILTKKIAKGRSATVAIKDVTFIKPVSVGSTVSCFAELINTGRSSIEIRVHVWIANLQTDNRKTKVADGTFIFVAIDDQGNSRPLPE